MSSTPLLYHRFLPPQQHDATSYQLGNALPYLIQEQSNALALHDKWSPPPSNWLKLNVNVALFDIQQRLGFGAVLRDS